MTTDRRSVQIEVQQGDPALRGAGPPIRADFQGAEFSPFPGLNTSQIFSTKVLVDAANDTA
jgi:hypothetical protein